MEIGKFTADEKQNYYKSLENMGDYYNIISTAAEEAEKRGLEKGFEKGHAEGRAEGRAEGIVKGMTKTLVSLVKKGRITLEEAAEEAKIEVDAFKQLLDEENNL